jgi:hypothetical protein
MSQQNVGHLVDMLLTDEELRTHFALDPFDTIVHLHLQGLALTIDEIAMFVRSDVESWCRVKHDLPSRLH